MIGDRISQIKAFERAGDTPESEAFLKAGVEGLAGVVFLMRAGFSDAEALGLAVASTQIDNPEEALSFLDSLASANGFREQIRR